MDSRAVPRGAQRLNAMTGMYATRVYALTTVVEVMDSHAALQTIHVIPAICARMGHAARLLLFVRWSRTLMGIPLATKRGILFLCLVTGTESPSVRLTIVEKAVSKSTSTVVCSSTFLETPQTTERGGLSHCLRMGTDLPLVLLAMITTQVAFQSTNAIPLVLHPQGDPWGGPLMGRPMTMKRGIPCPCQTMELALPLAPLAMVTTVVV
mmetsp:Transcript_44139/g.82024  ORF Transcript_44139/g.82024 Transcript_44139/m.82024 type:complete len:209 (-) Transcript_44139:738-1364(-)